MLNVVMLGVTVLSLIIKISLIAINLVEPV
jgi:hypothetical protein